MHVIVFALHLDKLTFKIGAHAGENRSQVIKGGLREYFATLFCHKDQMRMQSKYAGPSSTIIIVISHSPYRITA